MSGSTLDHDRPWLAQRPWVHWWKSVQKLSQCSRRACVQWGQPLIMAGACRQHPRGCPRTCGQHHHGARIRREHSTVVQFPVGNSLMAFQPAQKPAPSCPQGMSGPALCIGHHRRHVGDEGLRPEHSTDDRRCVRSSDHIFSIETATTLTSTASPCSWHACRADARPLSSRPSRLLGSAAAIPAIAGWAQEGVAHGHSRLSRPHSGTTKSAPSKR